MSKFTKALEKIQDDREETRGAKANGAVKKESHLKLPSAEEMSSSERTPYWERMTTVKNTIPDNKVVMLRFPDSMIAEQYRMLRTSLKAELGKTSAKVIMVSSSIHSEGKSVSATNLAVSLAETGDAKVALIDADLRRGKVGEYLGMTNDRPGLSEFLSEELSPKQVMVRGALKNLYVMTRGKVPKKPSELISSHKYHVLITELRTHFDYVIIDAPPIMSVADAAILGREADGVLFVIQIGRTPKSVIAHSHLLFKQANLKMFGYVLTNVEYQSADYRYYSNYYYGEDLEARNSLKEKTRRQLKKAGWGFRTVEDKFNTWWDKAVLKKNGKAAPAGKSDEEEQEASKVNG